MDDQTLIIKILREYLSILLVPPWAKLALILLWCTPLVTYIPVFVL
jgi:hypothetical protein